MHYVIVGHDNEKHESWMLHGIYMNRADAERGRARNEHSEITPHRYTYTVVDIAQKEMELFRSLPADPVIQAKALVTDVTLFVKGDGGGEMQTVDFTNIPMEHVHAAIAVMNGDTEIVHKGDLIGHTSPIPRTEDFTTNELFGNPSNPLNIPEEQFFECFECGVPVINFRRHTTWHNKLLP